MDTDKRIRVLLADNHPIVRAGIRAQLEKIPGVEVVGEANDGRDAVDMVDNLQPNVVFMDITMPNLNGLEATKRITQKHQNIRVIILSRHENEEYYWGALRSGASGYLLKKAGTAELETALLRVAEGEIYLSREIAIRLRKKFPLEQIAQSKSPLEQLTARPTRNSATYCRRSEYQSDWLATECEPQNRRIPSGPVDGAPQYLRHSGLVRFALRSGWSLKKFNPEQIAGARTFLSAANRGVTGVRISTSNCESELAADKNVRAPIQFIFVDSLRLISLYRFRQFTLRL